MQLEQLESDLKKVDASLAQSVANHNVLVGQKQIIEHYITKLKAGEPVADVATPEDIQE